MTSLISLDQLRKQAKGKPHPRVPADTGLFRASIGEAKEVGDKARTFRFVFSDGSVDRMGDTISPDGWNLHDFVKNPVALFAHDSSSPPIGRASNLMVEDGKLKGDIEFAPADVYPFAETIYRMVAGGWLNAVSVGFQPKEYDWADDEDREWGLDFKRQDLLEISIVPVPALPSALIEARAKGVDTRPLVEWAEKTLESGDKIIIPRAELERLRKAAKEPAMTKPRKTAAKADGMSEGDPADGGAAVGNCGRPIGNECGMKDVADCSIHGQGGAGVGDDAADAEKRLAALIAKTVRAEVTKAMKAVGKIVRRDPEDGDSDSDSDRPDMSEDHEKCVRMAHMHVKAMGDALDIAGEHADKAMDALETVKSALDASPPSDDGQGADDDQEEKSMAARLKAIKARIAAV